MFGFPQRLEKWICDSTEHTHAEVEHLWNNGHIRYIPDHLELGIIDSNTHTLEEASKSTFGACAK